MLEQVSEDSLGQRTAVWSKPTDRLAVLFEVGLCAALLYGANLYFATNADIHNPVVPLWWSFAKDAALTLAFGTLLFNLHDKRRIPFPMPLAMTFAFAGGTAALCLLWFGVSGPTLSFAKNLVLYFAGGAFVGMSLAGRSSAPELGFRIARAVCISILIGAACLWLPVQPTDGRLYGTYGNPTSLGYAAFVAFVLVTAFRPPAEAVFFAFALGAVYVMAGSLSILAAAGAFLLLLAVLEFLSRRRARPYTRHVAALAISVLVCGALFQLLDLPAFGYERLAGTGRSLLHSDSITIRLAAFGLQGDEAYHRYDSFLLGLYKNVGALPLLMYAGVLAALAWRYIRSARTQRQNAVAAGLVCILLVNPLLQHQMEVFPTNLLFGIFLGCAIVWLGNSRTASPMSRNPAPHA